MGGSGGWAGTVLTTGRGGAAGVRPEAGCWPQMERLAVLGRQLAQQRLGPRRPPEHSCHHRRQDRDPQDPTLRSPWRRAAAPAAAPAAAGAGRRRPYVLLMTGMNEFQIDDQLFDRVWFPAAGPRLREIADLHVAASPAEAAKAMPLAEVIVYWGEDPWPYDVLSEHLPAATRLRWLQSCSAGVEKLCAVFTAHRPASESVIVTNAKGVYGPVLAEHALFCCLHFSRRYPYFEANRQARLWQSFSPYSLRGQTLAIVGFGLSGLEIARLAHAFGMQVEVLRSTLVDEMAKEEREELIDRIVERHDLHSLLATADFVVSVGAPDMTRSGAFRMTRSRIFCFSPSSFGRR